MAKNDDLFGKDADKLDAKKDDSLIDATDPEANKPDLEPHEQGTVPPLDPAQPGAEDSDKAPAESPANPQIEQPVPAEPDTHVEPNTPGKLPEHGVENENEDVVKNAIQQQRVHQALVFALRGVKELAGHVKEADTKYSQVAQELDTFLAGYTGKIESVQSEVPQGAGADASHGDPGQRSFTKI